MIKKRFIIITVLTLLFVVSGCSGANDAAQGSLNDGTYTGIGQGYKDEIELEITVENGLISAVDLVWHDETAAIFTDAWDSISAGIIGEETTEGIDVVSGSTLSSNGLLEALNDAINKAK